MSLRDAAISVTERAQWISKELPPITPELGPPQDVPKPPSVKAEDAHSIVSAHSAVTASTGHSANSGPADSNYTDSTLSLVFKTVPIRKVPTFNTPVDKNGCPIKPRKSMMVSTASLARTISSSKDSTGVPTSWRKGIPHVHSPSSSLASSHKEKSAASSIKVPSLPAASVKEAHVSPAAASVKKAVASPASSLREPVNLPTTLNKSIPSRVSSLRESIALPTKALTGTAPKKAEISSIHSDSSDSLAYADASTKASSYYPPVDRTMVGSVITRPGASTTTQHYNPYDHMELVASGSSTSGSSMERWDTANSTLDRTSTSRTGNSTSREQESSTDGAPSVIEERPEAEVKRVEVKSVETKPARARSAARRGNSLKRTLESAKPQLSRLSIPSSQVYLSSASSPVTRRHSRRSTFQRPVSLPVLTAPQLLAHHPSYNSTRSNRPVSYPTLVDSSYKSTSRTSGSYTSTSYTSTNPASWRSSHSVIPAFSSASIVASTNGSAHYRVPRRRLDTRHKLSVRKVRTRSRSDNSSLLSSSSSSSFNSSNLKRTNAIRRKVGWLSLRIGAFLRKLKARTRGGWREIKTKSRALFHRKRKVSMSRQSSIRSRDSVWTQGPRRTRTVSRAVANIPLNIYSPSLQSAAAFPMVNKFIPSESSRLRAPCEMKGSLASLEHSSDTMELSRDGTIIFKKHVESDAEADTDADAEPEADVDPESHSNPDTFKELPPLPPDTVDGHVMRAVQAMIKEPHPVGREVMPIQKEAVSVSREVVPISRDVVPVERGVVPTEKAVVPAVINEEDEWEDVTEKSSPAETPSSDIALERGLSLWKHFMMNAISRRVQMTLELRDEELARRNTGSTIRKERFLHRYAASSYSDEAEVPFVQLVQDDSNSSDNSSSADSLFADEKERLAMSEGKKPSEEDAYSDISAEEAEEEEQVASMQASMASYGIRSKGSRSLRPIHENSIAPSYEPSYADRSILASPMSASLETRTPGLYTARIPSGGRNEGTLQRLNSDCSFFFEHGSFRVPTPRRAPWRSSMAAD